MVKRNGKKKRTHQQTPKINRKYKDRLFRLVFKDKKDLLELYNAVNHTDYKNVDDLEVNTLSDVLYLSMKNDLSFLISGTMNLYEHQSTYNPNMPLRGLMYFAKLYERYVAERGINLYRDVLQKLPEPRYLVFYNGTKEQPDVVKLKLSDAFLNDLDGKECSLECTAIMLNINYGHNRELMDKCRRLEEYSIFVATIREKVEEGKTLETAAKEAIDECIKNGVLRDVLVSHRTEVISMVLTSFNQEIYDKGLKQDGIEKVNKLNLILLEEKRYADLERAAKDTEFQEKLFEQYGLE